MTKGAITSTSNAVLSPLGVSPPDSSPPDSSPPDSTGHVFPPSVESDTRTAPTSAAAGAWQAIAAESTKVPNALSAPKRHTSASAVLGGLKLTPMSVTGVEA